MLPVGVLWRRCVPCWLLPGLILPQGLPVKLYLRMLGRSEGGVAVVVEPEQVIERLHAVLAQPMDTLAQEAAVLHEAHEILHEALQ